MLSDDSLQFFRNLAYGLVPGDPLKLISHLLERKEHPVFVMLMKGNVDRDTPESDRRLKDNQLAWVDQLVEKGLLKKQFNTTLFTAGDSRDPELAGIWGAVVGSFLTLLATLSAIP